MTAPQTVVRRITAQQLGDLVNINTALLVSRYQEAIALLHDVQNGPLTAELCLRIDAAIAKAEGRG